MGQTLDNGIYLPSEGERNCYTGLAENWRALNYLIGGYNVHIADAVIHVSQADRDKWDAVDNKADASALTAHTGDTTIHVTAEDKETWDGHVADTAIHVTAADKQAWDGHVADTTIHVTAEDKSKWDAVTSKADDSDVLHRTGDEEASGKKQLNTYLTLNGNALGNEFSGNARTCAYLTSNRDTIGKSGVFMSKFRQNRAQGSMSGIDVVQVTFDVFENEVRSNRLWYLNFLDWSDDVPQTVELRSLCSKVDYKLTHINGQNPGRLSLPNLRSGVDISSYITLNDDSNYTPPADGYIYLCCSSSNACGIWIRDSNNCGVSSGSIGSVPTYNNIVSVCVPVINDVQLSIFTPSCSNILAAMFFPCLGNV